MATRVFERRADAVAWQQDQRRRLRLGEWIDPRRIVDSADEVDRLTEQMRAAGARVTKESVAAQFFTGRSAYLREPEDNYFEIAWADTLNNPSSSQRDELPAPEHQRYAESCSGEARQFRRCTLAGASHLPPPQWAEQA